MRKTYGRYLPAFALIGGLLAASTLLAAELPTSPTDVRPALIGSTIDELSLKAADGSDFDLAAAMKKKPTILIIYRGGW